MQLKEFQWAGISRYRSELMGLAILFVILFHVSLPQTDAFFGLRRMGNIGVDLFFFLSGVGLWFSLVERMGLRRFFRRRYLRIYPTWLIVACLYYIPLYLKGGHNIRATVDLLGDILVNWDFWLHDELTFWYIPATMMLYFLAPGYVRLVSRHPVYRWLPLVAIVWCCAVQWVKPLNDAVGHLEIFWSRIPIFLLGMNCGQWVRDSRTETGSALWLLLLLIVLPLGTCLYMEQQLHGRFPLFAERMLYIPLSVSSLLLLSKLFSVVPERVRHALRFLGSLSLELYLLHAHFVLVHVERWRLTYWGTALVCLLLSLPLAWMLHRAVHILIKRFEK